MTTPDDKKEMLNRIRRLTKERDLLLNAIAPTDYDKIKSQMDAVSESPDLPLSC